MAYWHFDQNFIFVNLYYIRIILEMDYGFTRLSGQSVNSATATLPSFLVPHKTMIYLYLMFKHLNKNQNL